MRSLRTWLTLGLVLALAAPAAAGAGGYLAAEAWRGHRLDARLATVKRLLATAPADSQSVGKELSRQGVEAVLQPVPDKAAVFKAGAADKARLVAQQVMTPGLEALLQTPGSKRALQRDYQAIEIDSSQFSGTLYVRRPSAAARWAVALAAAALALAAALAVAVSLLRRWS